MHATKKTDRLAHVLAVQGNRRSGASTTAINLAAFLANAGYRTVLIDMCPNADATTHLGVDSRDIRTSIYELLINENVKFADAIIEDIRPNLALLPAKNDLYAADIELVYVDNREYRLKQAIDKVSVNYDFILIDCTSWLGGMLPVVAFTAADGVILSLKCDWHALQDIEYLLNIIRLVRDRLNNKVMLFGMVLTMYDLRTDLSKALADEISQYFPKEKFDTLIPCNIRLSEAPSYGRTILEHDPRSPGALAYQKLAEEVIARAAKLKPMRA